jgi:hypothetical protein
MAKECISSCDIKGWNDDKQNLVQFTFVLHLLMDRRLMIDFEGLCVYSNN